jgi:glycosyltransferase involved in cell wall biosynthesis
MYSFIKKNVESFLKQTYQNLELVISDHSVGDEIKEYIISLNNPKIVYIKNENDRGLQVENMNNAISNCTGDYIKLMNHDDYMESKDTIECGVKKIINGSKQNRVLPHRWISLNLKMHN